MSYTAVPTVATGDPWSAANHNTYIRDNFAWIFDYLFPVGAIAIWSGSIVSIPANWHLCDGTGGTPDLRNRFVIGAGGTYAVGAAGGSTTKDLSHTHTQNVTGSESSHTHTQGNTGSESAHTHTQGNTGSEASHVHSQGNTGAEAAHTHGVSGNTGGASDPTGWNVGTSPNSVQDKNHTHTVSITSGAGSSHAHSNPTTNAGSAHSHTNPTTAAGSAHSHTNPTTSAGSAHNHTNPTTNSGGSTVQDIMPPYYALAFIQRIS